jgi:hypothetical protein
MCVMLAGMTMNVYGHVNLDTQRAALDALDDELEA